MNFIFADFLLDKISVMNLYELSIINATRHAVFNCSCIYFGDENFAGWS